MMSLGNVKGYNLKTHQVLKKFAKLTQKKYHIFSTLDPIIDCKQRIKINL